MNFLNISQWAPNVEYVRHESVIQVDDSLQWIKDLIKRWGLETSVVKKKKKDRSLAATATTAADDLDIKISLNYKSNKKGRLFNATEHMLESIWFNKQHYAEICSGKGDSITKEERDICAKIKLIGEEMDQTVESLIGYSTILKVDEDLPSPWTVLKKNT